eukprot:EG_transcript_8462
MQSERTPRRAAAAALLALSAGACVGIALAPATSSLHAPLAARSAASQVTMVNVPRTSRAAMDAPRAHTQAIYVFHEAEQAAAEVPPRDVQLFSVSGWAALSGSLFAAAVAFIVAAFRGSRVQSAEQMGILATLGSKGVSAASRPALASSPWKRGRTATLDRVERTVLFNGDQEPEPEPQKQTSQSRWQAVPPPPSIQATQVVDERDVNRWKILGVLHQFGVSLLSAATRQTQQTDQIQNLAESVEFFVPTLTTSTAWDPAIVSDPVVAAKPVTAEELTDSRLMELLLHKRDEELNILVWKCLGYRYVCCGAGFCWDTSNVFPKWRYKYPQPPDLVGISGDTSKTIEAVEFLAQLTAETYRNRVAEYSKTLGLRYNAEHVKPEAEQKVQVTQWIMYYRDQYFGISMEELLNRKQQMRQEKKEEFMRSMQMRADTLGVTLEEVLEREERKMKRQRMEQQSQPQSSAAQ